MKGSLQDQLLKAGLVSKEQRNSVKAHKKKQAKTKKSARKGNQEAQQLLSFEAQQKAQADRQKEERKQRDQKLNEEREASRRKRAIAAAIQQLVNSHRVKVPDDADVAFHFQQSKRVKKIWVTPDLQDLLGRGRLAIIPLGEQYHLIPVEVAKRIEERIEGKVIFVGNKESDVVEDDDPYADYKIPDDLMW